MPHFEGGCHCGKIRFTAELSFDALVTCNCSICNKTGAIMTFIPEGQFKALSGEQEMVDYQFGKKALHHTFCPVCGIRPFSRNQGPDGSPMVMVNVRCLDGIDAAQLEIKTRYDGRSL